MAVRDPEVACVATLMAHGIVRACRSCGAPTVELIDEPQEYVGRPQEEEDELMSTMLTDWIPHPPSHLPPSGKPKHMKGRAAATPCCLKCTRVFIRYVRSPEY